MPRTRFPALLAVALACGAAAGGARAAAAQTPLPREDGRLRGAPSREVSYADLPTGSAQSLVLNPRYHTFLEFPLGVAFVSTGTDKLVHAEVVDGNKVALKPKHLWGETSMTLILDDDQGTTVPYIIRLDTAATPVLTVRYTDPVVRHVREAEEAMAARLESAARARFAEDAERALRARLLGGYRVIRFHKDARAAQENRFGERAVLEVADALALDQAGEAPRLYLRYRVANLTGRPITGLRGTVSVLPSAKRRAAAAKKGAAGAASVPVDAFDVEDFRDGAPIPPGTYVEGLLVLDDPRLLAGDRLRVVLENADGVKLVVVAEPDLP